MADPLTIVFMPESAYGPTNNCIGIGKILEQRGHRVVFAAEAALSRADLERARALQRDQSARQHLAALWSERDPQFAVASGAILNGGNRVLPTFIRRHGASQG